MARDIENIAEELFDKIKTRFESVRLGDEHARNTVDPKHARYVNFDFELDGLNLGNITISIVDGNNLKVYYNKDIVDGIKTGTNDATAEGKWYSFLRSLRQFARRNMMGFDARDITKSNLELRDVKQQSVASGIKDANDVRDISVNEAWQGTKKSSYQKHGAARIIVRHSKTVDETKHGSRTRNIESIFLENAIGERWLLPFKNLHAARAMAQHVAHGGKIDDDLGQGVVAICREMNEMACFVRGVRRRQFEDVETQDMAQVAIEHYKHLKETLKKASTARGYQRFAESYEPDIDANDEVDVDLLKERFVKKIYDDRLTQALPWVYRAYQRRKNSMVAEIAEFEQWADTVAKPSWADPDDDDDESRLAKIMSKPLTVGTNGDNAIGTLHDIISDDSLVDELSELGDQDPEADARPLVQAWLEANQPELAAKFRTNYQQPEDQKGEPATGSTGTDEPDVSESLTWLKELAGL